MSEVAYRKNKVNHYVEKEDAGARVKFLCDPIAENDGAENVAGAVQIREKPIETDDMALTEILRSGEIIEEEEKGALNEKHKEIWSKLYSILTKAEAEALYNSLKEESIETDVILFEEGKPNDRLFFINMGDLKMVYAKGDRKTLLKKFSTGDIVGEDTFFNIGHCTTSVITLSRVQLHMLEETALSNLEKDFPKLKAKLLSYCLKLEQVPDLLKKKNLDRRIQKRYRIKGPVIFQLVTKFGERMGRPFKGTLSDISAGGLSFYIKTPKKEVVRMLLGRNLNLRFSLSEEGPGQDTDLDVTVVGVCDHFFNDFSLHIKFDQPLDDKMLESVRPLDYY
jgi:CRP-like cAMP-binding protein